MSLQGFDTKLRKMVPVGAIVRQPSANVVSIECEVGYSITIFVSSSKIEALVTDDDDADESFRIGLLPPKEGESVSVKRVSQYVVEVHYE